MYQSHVSLAGIVNNDTRHQRGVTQVGNSLNPGSAAQQPIDQQQHSRANGDCGDGLFFDERRDAVEGIAVGFGQLASRLTTRTFRLPTVTGGAETLLDSEIS